MVKTVTFCLVKGETTHCLKIKDNVHELPVCACVSETHSVSPPAFQGPNFLFLLW